jgi:hypothetical protein
MTNVFKNWQNGAAGAGRVTGLFVGIILTAVLSVTVIMPLRAYALWDYQGSVDTSWYNASSSSFSLSNAAQLAGLSKLVEEGNTFEGKIITLANDIDISGNEWEPIGDPYTSTLSFNGTFDGDGHEVSGLTINNTESNQALFGNISHATIKNLTVRGSVICSVNGAGIVANANQSNLSHLTNYATVQAIGTFSGSNTVKSYNGRAAGVVAYSIGMGDAGSEYTYDNLVNYGDISATAPDGNGGVIGAIMASDGNTFNVKNCYNYGDVYVSMAQNSGGVEDGVGGVIGTTSSYGTYHVDKCGNEGNIFVNNNGSAGGLIGSIRGENSTVSNSYNTGSVTSMGTEFNEPTDELPTAAGLISHFGSTGGSVTNNYSTGQVSASSGYSAALVGAASQAMESFAFNNYYLEGSSTGAFNDMETGDSWDSALAGESLSADALADKIDTENGGVKDLDMSNYTLTEIETVDVVDEEPEIIVPSATITFEAKLAVLLAAIVLLIFGSFVEWQNFKRQREGGSRYGTSKFA